MERNPEIVTKMSAYTGKDTTEIAGGKTKYTFYLEVDD